MGPLDAGPSPPWAELARSLSTLPARKAVGSVALRAEGLMPRAGRSARAMSALSANLAAVLKQTKAR